MKKKLNLIKAIISLTASVKKSFIHGIKSSYFPIILWAFSSWKIHYKKLRDASKLTHCFWHYRNKREINTTVITIGTQESLNDRTESIQWLICLEFVKSWIKKKRKLKNSLGFTKVINVILHKNFSICITCRYIV